MYKRVVDEVDGEGRPPVRWMQGHFYMLLCASLPPHVPHLCSVKVNTIHVQPLGMVQEVELGISGSLSSVGWEGKELSLWVSCS